MPQGSQHWLTDLWILSATALLWAEGSVLVCVLVLLVAISHRLQIWYGIRRRERASPTVLRTPRHPGYSARFSPKKLQRRLSVASFVLTSLAWLPIIWTYWDRATDNGSLLFLVLISGFVLAAIGAQFGLRTGGLRLVKWWLDRDFRIVVFRRNSPKNVYAHLLLMAACGRYGQSIALNDETLEQADKGFLTGRAKSEGEWFRIFAEQDHQIEMDVLRTDWQRTVLSELEFADFAVFDWVETVTEAMIWELEMSALNLPAHRVLVLASAETLPLVHMAFSRLDATYVAKVTCVEVNREYDEGFIWKSHRAFIAEVDNTLARLMAKLGRESREVRVMAMTGAWPLPTC